MKKNLNIGDTVTCKTPVRAFYSDYAGNPEVIFRPGMVGVVKALNVPAVTGKERTYTCVDFNGPWSIGKNPIDIWRVALHDKNIKKIKIG